MEFRELDKSEEQEFRNWARECYSAGDLISKLWHPVARDECVKINKEEGVSTLRFSDGMEFETSGKLRSVKKDDGWYVVGKGYLIPVGSRDEAKKKIEEMKGDENA